MHTYYMYSWDATRSLWSHIARKELVVQMQYWQSLCPNKDQSLAIRQRPLTGPSTSNAFFLPCQFTGSWYLSPPSNQTVLSYFPGQIYSSSKPLPIEITVTVTVIEIAVLSTYERSHELNHVLHHAANLENSCASSHWSYRQRRQGKANMCTVGLLHCCCYKDNPNFHIGIIIWSFLLVRVCSLA